MISGLASYQTPVINQVSETIIRVLSDIRINTKNTADSFTQTAFDIWTSLKSHGKPHTWALITTLSIIAAPFICVMIFIFASMFEGSSEEKLSIGTIFLYLFSSLIILVLIAIPLFIIALYSILVLYPLAFWAAYWCAGKLWLYILLSFVIFIIFLTFWIILAWIGGKAGYKIGNVIVLFIVCPIIELLIECTLFIQWLSQIG